MALDRLRRYDPVPDGGDAVAECGRVNSLPSEDGTYTASE
jgi:hypothetical protein